MVIRDIGTDAETRDALSKLLIDTVALGGSVSFLHPLDDETAQVFWDDAFAAISRNERLVLGAFDGVLAGTVTLVLKSQPNQPHRAEIVKMMVRPDYRGRGIATLLIREAERRAIALGRTLLVLDTASDGGASRLYERLGYTLVGEIPDYALKPRGGFTAAKFYWKNIA